MMDNEERVDQLIEAQDLLKQAVELIESALKGTSHERYAQAYLVSHLKIRIGSDEASYDDNVQKYIDALIEDPEDEDTETLEEEETDV